MGSFLSDPFQLITYNIACNKVSTDKSLKILIQHTKYTDTCSIHQKLGCFLIIKNENPPLLKAVIPTYLIKYGCC